jgi:hypothetical protein
MIDWQAVNTDTERLPVPGGWLYKVRSGHVGYVVITFVPSPYDWQSVLVAAVRSGR